ncbi:MAG: gamma-glutamylcyclotransferase [Granulosicoccus sp.]|nr:gamma-glutamylcyclotransferase [Granulosicoccus sp.]
MANRWIDYFGYGSLVNRDTRPEGESAVNASLYGWQRSWSHRVNERPPLPYGCTSLTVEPVPHSRDINSAKIEGVLVRIAKSDLAELDKRERGYQRLHLSADHFDLPSGHDCDEVVIYRSLPENRQAAGDQYPILQSYIDCVMAGYVSRFGESGLRRMVQTTIGWEGAILNDRLQPLYPRHVRIDQAQMAYFDQQINSRS